MRSHYHTQPSVCPEARRFGHQAMSPHLPPILTVFKITFYCCQGLAAMEQLSPGKDAARTAAAGSKGKPGRRAKAAASESLNSDEEHDDGVIPENQS